MAIEKGVPAGFHTITPSLTVRRCSEAIEFYKRALGAEELSCHQGPDGMVMHADLKIGGSIFMCNDEFPQMGVLSPEGIGGTPVGMYVYVADADALYNRATGAGATVVMPIADMFWGDRCGVVNDPYGHRWTIATRKEELTPAQLAERQKAAMAEFKAKK